MPRTDVETFVQNVKSWHDFMDAQRVRTVVEDDADEMDAPSDWDMGAVIFDPYV